MKRNYFVLYSLIFLTFVSCKKSDSNSNFDIGVSWELITNFASEKEPIFTSVFSLNNQGSFDLNDENWKMYFSIAPRKIIDSSITAKVKIKCLGGDFYEMSPTAGFTLAAGEKIDIQFNGEMSMIKIADAPIGVYFVYNQDGNEKFYSTDVAIAPFTKSEQINRHKADKDVIPSAKNSYFEYDWSKVSPQLTQIVPTPVKQSFGNKTTTIDKEWGVTFDKGLENEGDYFKSTFADLGVDLNGTTKKVILTLDAKISSSESYRLSIGENKIEIKGSDAAGVFYGIQSILSLMPVESFAQKTGSITLSQGTIEDAPRYDYRGMHVDVGRNFQKKETIFKMLDLMALYKLNKLLFYLTEDEGWRIEIKQLPELAEVGGRRGHTIEEESHLRPAYGSGIDGKYGTGYYTQEEYIEIVQYANERHIEIIPEVNLPGHSRAAITAMNVRYKRKMAEGDEAGALEYLLVDFDDASVYESAQGYSDNVVCVCRESVYKFYETVIDEIIDMHKRAGVPLKWFHTGGDEVAKGAWEKSKICQEFLAQNNDLSSASDLQPYFLKRANEMLTKKGITTAGWEEVALKADENGVLEPNPYFSDKDVIPYVWQNIWGNEDLGYKLANGGYPVVLCNVTNLYFDLAYSKDPREPGLYWAGFINTRSAWEFIPDDMFKSTKKDDMGNLYDPDKDFIGKEMLKPEFKSNILGIEGQLWSETVKGPDMLEYYYLPKIIGLAERAWAPNPAWATIEDTKKRNSAIDAAWWQFAAQLGYKELPRLNYIYGGSTYRIAPPGGIIKDGKLFVSTPMPGFEVRYTTDGTEPTVKSPKYVEPVVVNGDVVIKSFDKEGNSSLSFPVK